MIQTILALALLVPGMHFTDDQPLDTSRVDTCWQTVCVPLYAPDGSRAISISEFDGGVASYAGGYFWDGAGFSRTAD